MKPTLAILGIIACAVISAAGGLFYFDHVAGGKKIAAKVDPAEVCVGKVMYLKFDGGFFGSPAVVTKLKPDGKVWTCGGA